MAKNESGPRNDQDSVRRAAKQRQQAVKTAAAKAKQRAKGSEPVSLFEVGKEKRQAAREVRDARIAAANERRAARDKAEAIREANHQKAVALMAQLDRQSAINFTDADPDVFDGVVQSFKRLAVKRQLGRSIQWNNDWFTSRRFLVTKVK